MFIQWSQKENNLEKVGVGLDPVVEVLDPSEDGRAAGIAVILVRRSYGHLHFVHHQRRSLVQLHETCYFIPIDLHISGCTLTTQQVNCFT
jgi:hypothetical protein